MAQKLRIGFADAERRSHAFVALGFDEAKPHDFTRALRQPTQAILEGMRFKAGRVHQHSPMPWEAFQGMTDSDLVAIYRYLKTVPAASGGPDPYPRQVRVAAH